MPIEISAPLHLQTLLGSNTYLLVDFYATWCPPCKAIAPVFEQLSSQHTIPGKLAFAKVNVDEQTEVAAKYGITAMPTFLLLKGNQVVESVRGADVRQIKSIVERVVAEVGKAGTEEEKKETKAAPKSTEGLSMVERLGLKAP
ncbi:thioredoxin-domain-containing protein [Westerdykella ornata]|uniref:Thioredoxin-domain-containing protein n=1 Tax=Westerdykella ornata TaxID=318751 RepID=A0A6A6JXG2_WESOR|nr:thioredoxin-domain-containing protein [Westerdykella ornata]KAF2281097.1 thioredoxin-domain-containing protein [Westerdykella ornata]